MSPILWDLGHIAHFEELWLPRNLDGPIEFVEMPGMYNPFEHPRSTRARCRCPGWPGPRDHERDPGPRPRSAASADFDADQSAPRRRVRVPDGAPARVPAQRDHPPDAPAQAGHALLAGPPASMPARVGERSARHRDGPLSRRPGRDRHRRPHRAHTTTSGRARRGRALRSGSTRIRSPTASTWSSSKPAATRDPSLVGAAAAGSRVLGALAPKYWSRMPTAG